MRGGALEAGSRGSEAYTSEGQMPGEDRSSPLGKPAWRARRIRRMLKSLESRQVAGVESLRAHRRNCLGNDTKDRAW